MLSNPEAKLPECVTFRVQLQLSSWKVVKAEMVKVVKVGEVGKSPSRGR